MIFLYRKEIVVYLINLCVSNWMRYNKKKLKKIRSEREKEPRIKINKWFVLVFPPPSMLRCSGREGEGGEEGLHHGSSNTVIQRLSWILNEILNIEIKQWFDERFESKSQTRLKTIIFLWINWIHIGEETSKVKLFKSFPVENIRLNDQLKL